MLSLKELTGIALLCKRWVCIVAIISLNNIIDFVPLHQFISLHYIRESDIYFSEGIALVLIA